MAVIIKNGKTYGDRSVSLTQAEYNALSETEKNNGTVYYIYDVDAVPQASDVVYDNSTSGLEAVNVQGAVDELNSGLTKALSLNLLWQDTAPPTSLSTKTVSVDCSKYSLFMLVSHNYEAAGTSAFFIFKGNAYNTYYVTSSGTTNYNTKMRTVQITDTSLIISAGYQGNNTSDNKVLIPYELYGVL